MGIIPYFKSSQEIDNTLTEQQIPEVPVRDIPRSPISEAYRMLQASLQFLSVDRQMKVIVVTSAVPQEGKSTVCANLATAIAQLGQRVLLIDADMRYPYQHYIWNLSNAVGFSNAIVEQASIKEAIQSRMINLDILTAGILPPNPIALLSSNNIAQLLKEVSTLYDYVILDTPALFLAADALILGKMADGVLIVGRPGFVDSTSAIAAKDRLTQSKQNILGLAINGIKTNNKPDNYFYYYAEGYDDHQSSVYQP